MAQLLAPDRRTVSRTADLLGLCQPSRELTEKGFRRSLHAEDSQKKSDARITKISPKSKIGEK